MGVFAVSASLKEIFFRNSGSSVLYICRLCAKLVQMKLDGGLKMQKRAGRTIFVIAAIMTASLASARAEVVMRCGASKGFTYILQGPLMPDASSWMEDGLSGGEILLLKDGEEFDLMYTDAVGSRSAKADGARVITLYSTPTDTVLLVAYNGSVETYHFNGVSNGGEVIWSQQKFNMPVNKVAAFRAACSSVP